jgi:UTP-glucose-1-phosphate uridylyltransferase
MPNVLTPFSSGFVGSANSPEARAGEVQLTDEISLLFDWKCKVYVLKLRGEELRIDTGDPEAYLKTLKEMPLSL